MTCRYCDEGEIPIPCPDCHGNGNLPSEEGVEGCSACHGSGEVTAPCGFCQRERAAALQADNERLRAALRRYADDCPTCGGTGFRAVEPSHLHATGRAPCPTCREARRALGGAVG